MTILEALNWAQGQLKSTADQKRIMQANPMLDAQVLLSHYLDKPTSYLFAHGEDELTPATCEAYQRLIERRQRHEPISHILQQKEFFGRPFFINQFVLTPRPETEIMVENAMSAISPESTLIEIGTGSGAIAVTLAAELQQPVIAIDIDPQALSVARRNARSHTVDHLIAFQHGSLLEPYIQKNIRETGHGIILANLPYLTPTQWELSDPDVKEYEPKHALVGGIDGLDLYDQLLQQVANNRNLFPAELDLYFEIDPRQERSIQALILEIFPQAQIKIIPDLNHKARIVKISI
ncbi:peptide chain release factor N(5)-glutamine methyltransferase [Candidatus Uhrbacteria bacterium]|jgi:release factor glutamine methyltransferase|nr:peptide chain release factor N(5)-glutamine methyltransferase [Candidatus Uhrbacteria bacterium]MBT7717555.1 peptide chain release factor N(5)-glutamine methyltransferase [Candidatus Uhrbacteria bacterium]